METVIDAAIIDKDRYEKEKLTEKTHMETVIDAAIIGESAFLYFLQ